MNKILLVILLAAAALSSCKKSLVGKEREEAQKRIDDGIIQQYITDNDLQDKAKRIDTTGVFYIVINPGKGNAEFTNSTLVTIGHKTRQLGSDEVIYETGKFHPSITLGSNLIKAWQLGIPQVQKGGTLRILSPSRYAYGPFPQPKIGLPANAVLDFEITLYDVTN
ncbi:hypothetical protein DJ568_10330 [Mucilaginibacter hurinus]|uniref:Peptidyl-prolyl cis-trans isomerase n=1 Tax=Mucilaginibacter hurinus TaxID=2201324 RepID=A0A367GP74_9SPHI|nr:FKBP-type peptidyl-prolyl cis-trans isomerase [Mucilaginibacter hurinus]RCH54868.1 hypothetical protein DJ568_10330 [Mucilaginibacter hurinus]